VFRDCVSSEFHYYELLAARPELESLGQGSTFRELAKGMLEDVELTGPPEREQRAIAAFLDRETARIDALVAKKVRLIELLQEERTALITRAVTKGREPNVPMKDSGVEWLGEIPAHWEVKKVKRLCLVRRGASPRPIDDPIYFDDEGEYAWVRIADVTASERYLERTTQRLSPLGKSKSVALEPGELFVSIAATVGKPVITKIKCCIHDGFVYFVGLHANREFLFYLLSCGEPYKGLGKLGTQLNLNTDTIGDIYLPRPSGAEQEAIVEFLDHETARIDALVSKVRDAIDRLKELRTSLISAAVTGKIDVRD
jgi:type I restriction enzyme S subunit